MQRKEDAASHKELSAADHTASDTCSTAGHTAVGLRQPLVCLDMLAIEQHHSVRDRNVFDSQERQADEQEAEGARHGGDRDGGEEHC